MIRGRCRTFRKILVLSYLTKTHRFTLLEIMVILGVLSVLASILVPILAESLQEARENQCQANLRQLGVAMGMYADHYDGAFPFTYGQLQTDAHAAWQSPSRASMAALVDMLEERESLYCPTFWHHSRPDHHGMTQSAYQPGGSLLWGYNKWAGTLQTKPLNAHGSAYARYQDLGQSVSHYGSGLRHPGYLSLQRLDQATRLYIVTGNSSADRLHFQSAFRPSAVRSLRGKAPIPPSELVLFADSNNIGEKGISTSHSRVDQHYDTPLVPPQIDGLAELKADGHVSWYDIFSTSLYYVSDGDPGGAGVFVQDNR